MRVSFPILPIVLMLSLPLAAQHQADVWVFGKNHDYSFREGSHAAPQLNAEREINSIAGGSSYCDPTTGRLLLYANNKFIYQPAVGKLNPFRPTRGGDSCSQGGFIVPNPADPEQLYVFQPGTVSADRASVRSPGSVSISLADLGTQKLVFQDSLIADINSFPSGSYFADAINATLDCSGKGFWVVAVMIQPIDGVKRHYFVAYHLTSRGILGKPTVTPSPVPLDTSYERACIKFSQNGTLIAYKNRVFDFDFRTGIVSNPQALVGVGFTVSEKSGYNLYSFSFSKNNLLYASRVTGQPEILQLKKDRYSESWIITHREPLFDRGKPGFPGSLQYSPDGRIIFNCANNFLGFVEFPEVEGVGCGVRRFTYQLVEPCGVSLPNVMDHVFSEKSQSPFCTLPTADFDVETDTVCVYKYIELFNKSAGDIETYYWSFAGGDRDSSGRRVPPKIKFIVLGTFPIRLVVKGLWWSDTLTKYVTVVDDKPTVSITFPNPILCPGQSVRLNVYGGTSVRWFPSEGLSNPQSLSPVCTPSRTITYNPIIRTSHGCEVVESVTVIVANSVQAKATNDTICRGEQATLYSSGGAHTDWFDLFGKKVFDGPIFQPKPSPSVTTSYKVVVSSGSCRDSTIATVIVNDNPSLVCSADTSVCEGTTVVLTAESQIGNTLQWSIGDSIVSRNSGSIELTPHEQDTVRVRATNRHGCSTSKSIAIGMKKISVDVSKRDTSLCFGSILELSARGADTYQWTDSAGNILSVMASLSFVCTASTRLHVTASKDGCVSRDSIRVSVLDKPVVTAEARIDLCEGEESQLRANGCSRYEWFLGEKLLAQTPDLSIVLSGDTVVKVVGWNLSNCQSDTFFVELFVKKKTPLYVVVPGVIAKAGDEISIPIQVQSLEPIEIAELRYRLRVPGHILYTKSNGIRFGGELLLDRTIFNVRANRDLQTLVQEPFLVLVAEENRAPIIVDQVSCIGTCVDPRGSENEITLNVDCSIDRLRNISPRETLAMTVATNGKSGELTIQADGLFGATTVELVNLVGERMLSASTSAPVSGSAEFSLPLQEIASGAYFVLLTSGTERVFLPIAIDR